MKALMVATVPSMIGQFNIQNLLCLKKKGFSVEIACNFKDYSAWNEKKINEFKMQMESLNIRCHQIDFSRNFLDVNNHIKAVKQMKALRKNDYDLVHCHTPIASAICRNTFKMAKCKVIYTAHGFHFYKGAPIVNWIIFYPIERFLARYTDILITINSEDYLRAKKFKLREKGRLKLIPGVGVDVKKIKNVQPYGNKIFDDLKISVNSKILISVGELNLNKNHSLIIKTMNFLPKEFHYIICGQGSSMKLLESMIEDLNLQERVHLLGYRNDIVQLIKSSNIFVFPSYREGLSVALLEAIVAEIPCLASKIRGNIDLIADCKKGELFDVNIKPEDLSKKIIEFEKKQERENWTKLNLLKYDTFEILKSYEDDIYELR